MFLMLSTASIELNRFEFDVRSLITDTTTMLCLTDEHQTISFSDFALNLPNKVGRVRVADE